ncbi:MAG: HAMP domain-containing protein [Candidatus Paceibacterota bacterium]
MNFHSLHFKIISGVIISSFLICALIFYFIQYFQQATFFELEKTQAFTASDYLSSSFSQTSDLDNQIRIQEVLYKLKGSYPGLIKADVNLAGEGGTMKTIASLDAGLRGRDADADNYSVFEKGYLSETYGAKDQPVDSLRIIAPVRIAGASYGTYDLVMPLNTFKAPLETIRDRILILISLGLVILVLALVLFLNAVVLKPIEDLQKGISSFSKGKFDHQIKEGPDEIGKLAHGLNEMSRELYKSYDSLEEAITQRTNELEEARTVLEIKVRARTRQLQEMNDDLEGQVKEKTLELQGKIQDLESFNKLMVDRELRMIELKSEIDKLRAKGK